MVITESVYKITEVAITGLHVTSSGCKLKHRVTEMHS